MSLLYTRQERSVSEYHAVAGGIATPNSIDQHLIDATETHLRAVCISKNYMQPVLFRSLEKTYTPSLAISISGVAKGYPFT